jgi:hypothetical protein
MISSQSSGGTPQKPEDEYIEAVRREIRGLGAYFAKQITRYRIARILVIISAAMVPVLASVSAAPRWVLGAFGALAVATEGIQQLYQFQRSALNAMSTANALERVLNAYMTGTGRYAGPVDQAFPLLVEDVEKIRQAADKAFLETWQAAAQPSSQRSTHQATTPNWSSIERAPHDGS